MADRSATDRRARDRIEGLLQEGWRIRCPAGHADLRDNQGATVYCRSCQESYRYERLVDAREDWVVVGPAPESEE